MINNNDHNHEVIVVIMEMAMKVNDSMTMKVN